MMTMMTMMTKKRWITGFLSLMTLLPLAATGLADGAKTPLDRSDIETQDKWNLKEMYASQDAWNRHHNQIEALIKEFAKLKGTAGTSPEQLLRVLQWHDRINVELDKIYAYASMEFDQDMRQSSAQAVRDRARTLVARYAESRAWFEPELTTLSRETINAWLDRDDLAVYRHFFDDLFRMKAHILSPREEELLAMASKASSASANTFSLLTNTELKHNTIQDSEGNDVIVNDAVYYDLVSSKDRRVRKDVYLALHGSYMDVKSTLASTLEGAAQRDWFYAKARGYNSSLEAALDQENLPVAVYHNLIDTVNQHLPLLHRYTALRKKALKLDEVHPYDLYASLVDAPEQRYAYPQAREMIIENLAPMGKEYVDALKMGFESRWIDVYATKGKRNGAYCGGAYLVHPYVLLNYAGNYDGVSTVAHEMGHAMQSHFANTSQPPVYADYPMFTAEVASTAAEIIFKRQILNQTTDNKTRAVMINHMLEDIRRTVFRQTRFAEFDLVIHEMAELGEPMTAEALMGKGRVIYRKYYGPDLVLDPEADVEVLRIPHHYYNFYVYRYADSYSAAATIAKRIMANDPGAVEDWMKFLKIGNSMYALDMLKIAGADLTTPKPIEDCMSLFEDLLNQLEALLEEL